MTVLVERPVLPPTDPAEQLELDDAAALLDGLPAHAALVAPDGTLVRLPPAVYDVIVQVITALRAGRAITVAPLAQRLTTQEAADLLGVSRPTLVKLLEDGKIPFEQPGRHRRVRLDDLIAFRDRRRIERSEALDELVRQTEELGLYEDESADEAR
jgi:excisionase family DNA binding protein